MRLTLKRRRVCCVAKSALAGLLALGVLLASLAAASPTLHRWLHGHGAAQHPCVVCAFVKGQVASPEATAAIASHSLTPISLVHRADTAPAASSDRRLDPSRAPPVS